MPPRDRRIIAGPRNTAYDHFIQDVVNRGAWGTEHDYFGIEDGERAEYIRKKLRTAGYHINHQGKRVAVKAFWKECTGCENGGPSCRFHVKYSVFPYDAAVGYKSKLQESARKAT